MLSSATGFTIIGISGVGKTTAVEVILSSYPQVIVHSQYRHRDLTLMQIVWLKLDCPFDGSIKGLCLNFFQAVDDLLGTNYSKNYTRGRPTVDELIPYMARVASLHGIGVLVIDEIQHLSEAKSGGSRKMLNFFVQLVNTIGVPVVLVGTYKALSILSGEFRQARRGSGQGDLVWDRMAEDEIWDLFIESLWRYQYVRQPCYLTPQLSHTLYDVTQGITDFAVKVYMLAQIRAIATGIETVTSSIIRSVAKDSLRLAQPILSALKTGDIGILHHIEDVHPLEITPFLQQAQTLVIGQLRSQATIKKTLIETEQEAKVNPQHQGSFGSLPETATPLKNIGTPPLTKTQSQQKNRHQTAKEKQDLAQIVAKGAEHGIAAYEAIRQSGYIRTATEFLLEDIS